MPNQNKTLKDEHVGETYADGYFFNTRCMLTTLQETEAKSQQSSGKKEPPGDMGKALSFTQLHRNIPPDDHKIADTSSNHLSRFFDFGLFFGFFLKTLYIIVGEELLNFNYTIYNG